MPAWILRVLESRTDDLVDGGVGLMGTRVDMNMINQTPRKRAWWSANAGIWFNLEGRNCGRGYY